MNRSSLGSWILAIRPRTLPAAVAFVVVGIALAIADGRFAPGPALAAMAVGLLMQIAVNLANDYFDFKKGVDSEERLGPIRVTQSGLISPQTVKNAMILALGLAAAAGGYLAWIAGFPVIVIAVAAILSALAYSGGPYPLASHGLGDLFVFFFFGPVAVCGTYYVQALTLTWTAVLMSAPVGLLITAILVVNNLRDIPTDKKAGKNTLAVKLGARGARIEYMLLLAAAFAIPIIHLIAASTSFWSLLPIASAPLALKRIRDIHARTGPELNQTLADTALLALVFSVLQSAGILVG